MSRDEDADVIVVGGGIAGLGLACALAPYDVRVLIIEKRKKAGGIHRGDSLLPRTTALFRRWGVLDAIRAADAQPIDRIEIHHHTRGKVCETPLGSTESHPYLVLPHARIEQVLLERALAFGRARLLRPARVTDVLREGGGRVRGVRFETPDGPGEARAPLVVACDGHRSVVRDRLGIAIEPLFYDHAYLGLEADRPASYENAMRVHFHERGGVLLMPRPTRVGIGMLVEAKSGEHWIRMSDGELRRELVARAPILSEVAIHREGAHVYELARAHAERYVSQGAVIMGDAAHATNPTAGQGMTMALGDAGALAEIVGPELERTHSGGTSALDEALARYEQGRYALNEKLVRRSHRLARIYALRGRSWDRLKLSLVRALATTLGRAVVNPILRAFLEEKRTEPMARLRAPPVAPPPSRVSPHEDAVLRELVDEDYEESRPEPHLSAS
jgi:2-polyprenyl-6-methoxyphenol hydroxylase-like FAD-dependent oxidoreductase